MTIYVMVIKDRHSDIGIYTFTDENVAINYGKSVAREYASKNEDEIDQVLTDAMKRIGWVYYGRYSSEGDSVIVYKSELDDMVKEVV